MKISDYPGAGIYTELSYWSMRQLVLRCYGSQASILLNYHYTLWSTLLERKSSRQNSADR